MVVWCGVAAQGWKGIGLGLYKTKRYCFYYCLLKWTLSLFWEEDIKEEKSIQLQVDVEKRN